jgi:hypothetical protein
MQITIKKPKLSKISVSSDKLGKSKVEGLHRSKNILEPIKLFYDFKGEGTEKYKLKPMKLVILTIVLALVSLAMYSLTSYVRSEELGLTEVLKQVAFINVTLWLAYLFFVIGINSIIYVVTRLKKLEINFYDFLMNQVLVAVVMFFFMRLVATVLILFDELVSFEIEVDLRIFQFNLLTILFITQILMLVIVYNHLKINLKGKLEKYPLIELGVIVLYLASIWSLTSP